MAGTYKFLGVRFVPEAEFYPGILNVGYRESCRSESAWLLPLSAQRSHPLHCVRTIATS